MMSSPRRRTDSVAYRDAVDYLCSKTDVTELCDKFGARVAVCPLWNGRVMTSTCNGLDGPSYGLVNIREIESAPDDPNNRPFGGEEQVSLYLASNSTSSIRLPDGPFVIESVPPDPQIRLRRSIPRTNWEIFRTIQLLTPETIDSVFGEPAAAILDRTDVNYVGFETSSTLSYRENGSRRIEKPVSLRTRSRFNSGLDIVGIIPFQPGSDLRRGPAFCSNHFGIAPHGRLRILPNAVLLRADGRNRCQIGVSRHRALPFFGSIDFRSGTLTLISYNMPLEPWKLDYLNDEYGEIRKENIIDFVNLHENLLIESDQDNLPYSGEVLRAYNHGPAGPEDEITDPYFEFDVFSPATVMLEDDELTHQQYTIHINAENQALSELLGLILGVDYDQVYRKMMR